MTNKTKCSLYRYCKSSRKYGCLYTLGYVGSPDQCVESGRAEARRDHYHALLFAIIAAGLMFMLLFSTRMTYLTWFNRG